MLGYSAIATAIIALIIKFTIGLRIDPEGEAEGADESQHAESAYDFAALGGSSGSSALSQSGVALGKEG